jgi:UDP-N-acetylglucosamine 2-epimerase (non-hydrolysing)
MLIDIIAGARPNFMKIAPIIEAINHYDPQNKHLRYRLIHTGQHYDKKLSDTFFNQLNIPEPHINMGVGSGSQAVQTANIMVKYEKILSEEKADLVLVVGDVTSTMACTIVAKKADLKVAHVEAGIRSFDLSMPEEINRMVTDAISDYFFTTTEWAGNNLKKAGIPDDRIFFVGNTMIDTLLKNLPNLKAPSFWHTYGLDKQQYLVTTLHRPHNVDNSEKLKNLLEETASNAQNLPIIFPAHPRTRKNLEGIKIPANIFMTDPLSYFEFIFLIKNAKAVITDSGGIQEESTVLNTPCITLRDNTERPETVSMGTNELIGSDPKHIKPWLRKLFAEEWKKGKTPDLWDGKTSHRIIQIIMNLYDVKNN